MEGAPQPSMSTLFAGAWSKRTHGGRHSSRDDRRIPGSAHCRAAVGPEMGQDEIIYPPEKGPRCVSTTRSERANSSEWT